MSLSEARTVIDGSLEVPAGIATAYNCSLRIVTESGAFIDRVHGVASLVNEIIAWRWSGSITGEQCGHLLRKLRRTVETNLGEITDRDMFSAEEVEERQREREEMDVYDSLGIPVQH